MFHCFLIGPNAFVLSKFHVFKTLIVKSRECHTHNLQPIPDTISLLAFVKQYVVGVAAVTPTPKN